MVALRARSLAFFLFCAAKRLRVATACKRERVYSVFSNNNMLNSGHAHTRVRGLLSDLIE